MPRIALDLNKEADRQKVKGQWRLGPGLVPGEPNEGLVARILRRDWPSMTIRNRRFVRTFARVFPTVSLLLREQRR